MASRGIAVMMVIGIALAVGLATRDVAAGGGGCHSPVMTNGRGTTVEMRWGCMSPTILQIQEGERVTFRNADPMVHVVVGAHSSWGNYANIAPGESVSYVFAQPGVYPYACHLHPGMTGAIVVGDGATAMAETQSKGAPLLAAMAVPHLRSSGMRVAALHGRSARRDWRWGWPARAGSRGYGGGSSGRPTSGLRAPKEDRRPSVTAGCR